MSKMTNVKAGDLSYVVSLLIVMVWSSSIQTYDTLN